MTHLVHCVVPTVDGGFAEWSSWSVCSATCEAGQQTRSRACTNPVPSNGGATCIGDTEETQPCNDGDCPGKFNMLAWIPNTYIKSIKIF